MSILIRGMEMPENCAECPVNLSLCKRGYRYLLDHMELYDRRAKDCPIVPVPPHGRLIDADALMREFEKAERMMEQHGQEYSCSFMSSGQEISAEWYCVEDMLENAPTVIPPEEDE